ncbi:myo-inositol-1-monophosphatase [Lepidopterella palustris CBS 459.81]|uniref:Inositol-1-monophosphatase n=1 Tax=Lepidopterella palustris CBS 459.81 TaxID=1314670 RepID=A0A8E2EFE2_9PEZI|nr:myo-inositol-1-monophosphatase [Lepidopterella palustris CBS 459.81]
MALSVASSITTPDLSDFSAACTPATSSLASSISSLQDVNDALLECLIGELNLNEIRDTLVHVANAAGEMMLSADPSVDTSESKKNSSDRVTATDKAVEAMVKACLTTAYPDFEFLGEESFKVGQKLSDSPTFVCDPIDGTLNFIHGFPNTAISLALTVAKKPVVGVVLNPFRQELYTAIKGQGAFLRKPNGSVHRLPTRQHPDPLTGLNGCLVAVEWGSERSGPNWDLRTDMTRKLMSAKSVGGAMCHSIRSSGSAALDFCYVAAGQMDLFWEGGCWIWDICAGWIILEEAGGLVASANPGDWEPSLEGRLYLAIRGAPSGQKQVVEELWQCMEGQKFVFAK